MRSELVRICVLAAALALAATVPGSGGSRPSGAGSVSGSPEPAWSLPASGYPWAFPRDHWAHPDFRSEWWYVTGQLASTGDRDAHYGFQFTLFRIGLRPDVPEWNSDWTTRGFVMGHLAITDLDRKEHVFSEVMLRDMPLLGGFSPPFDEPIAWSRAPAGTDGIWEFRADKDGFLVRASDAGRGIALDLLLHPEKPVVLEGPGGLSLKTASGDAASLYYSLTRLRTQGRIVCGRDSTAVSGLSWLDREWSSEGLGREQAGWDWFSLQLADGRDLMLYRLRGKSGTPDFGRATLVSASGDPRYLADGTWTIVPLRKWTSPHTHAVYPLSWTVRVPSLGLVLTVESLVDDQENVGDRSGLAYWEGAIVARDATGREAGRGYLELTGYGNRNARPAL
jgi:predicted secreted hydrolase